jgi:hypothetical protein
MDSRVAPDLGDVRATHVARVLAPAIVALVVMLDVAGYWSQRGSSNVVLLFALILSETVIAAVVGLLIVRRHPRHAVGWLLLAHGLLVAIVLGGEDQAEGVSPGIQAWISQLGQGSWVFLYVCLAMIGYLFPDGRFLNRRWRRFVLACLACYGLFLVAAAFDVESFHDAYPTLDPPLRGLPPAVAGSLGAVGLFGIAASLVGAVVCARSRLRRSDADERVRILWFAWAALAIPVGLVVCWLDYWITRSSASAARIRRQRCRRRCPRSRRRTSPRSEDHPEGRQLMRQQLCPSVVVQVYRRRRRPADRVQATVAEKDDCGSANVAFGGPDHPLGVRHLAAQPVRPGPGLWIVGLLGVGQPFVRANRCQVGTGHQAEQGQLVQRLDGDQLAALDGRPEQQPVAAVTVRQGTQQRFAQRGCVLVRQVAVGVRVRLVALEATAAERFSRGLLPEDGVLLGAPMHAPQRRPGWQRDQIRHWLGAPRGRGGGHLSPPPRMLPWRAARDRRRLR